MRYEHVVLYMCVSLKLITVAELLCKSRGFGIKTASVHSSSKCYIHQQNNTNDIIHLCGKMIQRSILSVVQSSPFYSVIADETSDVKKFNDEQLAISLRYLTANGEPQEKFLSFVEYLSEVSGEPLAGNILNK